MPRGVISLIAPPSLPAVGYPATGASEAKGVCHGIVAYPLNTPLALMDAPPLEKSKRQTEKCMYEKLHVRKNEWTKIVLDEEMMGRSIRRNSRTKKYSNEKLHVRKNSWTKKYEKITRRKNAGRKTHRTKNHATKKC